MSAFHHYHAKEKKLDLTDFSKRFLRPAMNSLSSKVNAYLLKSMYLQTPNVVGTWGTIPGHHHRDSAAASVLDNHLAPEADRCAHFSTDANDALAETNVTLFHTSDEIRGEFSKNAVGMFAGLEFYKQLALPTHTNGPGSGLVVTGTGNQGATLAIDDTKGDTRTALVVLSKGTIFTLAGVFETHPITGEATTRLRQFLVTTDYRRGEYGVTIYPPIVAYLNDNNRHGNRVVQRPPRSLSQVPLNGCRRILFSMKTPLHRLRSAAPVLANQDGYTATVKSISVRVMSFGDGKADVEHTRIDVLFGTPVAVRPDHACRVTQ
ncbi:P22 phage major capsid protein family protein [Xylella fastidiosa]|uniref:P22 phage major capsid protein family protein n=1 Tax=Xylella fastidiosa TaxID=2371 RepID=UPI003AFB7537